MSNGEYWMAEYRETRLRPRTGIGELYSLKPVRIDTNEHGYKIIRVFDRDDEGAQDWDLCDAVSERDVFLFHHMPLLLTAPAAVRRRDRRTGI